MDSRLTNKNIYLPIVIVTETRGPVIGGIKTLRDHKKQWVLHKQNALPHTESARVFISRLKRTRTGLGSLTKDRMKHKQDGAERRVAGFTVAA